MRITLLIAFSIILLGCNKDSDFSPVASNAVECSIKGRWHPEGFEATTLYELTDSLRYTIYSSDGTFGTIADAIPGPNPYTYANGRLNIDLFFGNSFDAAVAFKCDCKVVEFDQSGTKTRWSKEGYDITNCD